MIKSLTKRTRFTSQEILYQHENFMVIIQIFPILSIIETSDLNWSIFVLNTSTLQSSSRRLIEYPIARLRERE